MYKTNEPRTNINELIKDVFPNINELGINTVDIVNKIILNLQNVEMTEQNIKNQVSITVNKALEIIKN